MQSGEVTNHDEIQQRCTGRVSVAANRMNCDFLVEVLCPQVHQSTDPVVLIGVPQQNDRFTHVGVAHVPGDDLIVASVGLTRDRSRLSGGLVELGFPAACCRHANWRVALADDVQPNETFGKLRGDVAGGLKFVASSAQLGAGAGDPLCGVR